MRAGVRRRWLPSAGGRVVTSLLSTRLLFLVVAACAVRLVPGGLQPGTERYLTSVSLGAWVRWDAWWYVSVVERGYWFDPNGQSNAAFFPAFPAAIWLGTLLWRNPVVVGLLLANAAAVGGIIVFWRWVRAREGTGAADRAAVWLLVYPFSFFLHSIYAEAAFFLVATLALRAWDRDRPLRAGLWGALAAATRPMGVLLAPAFLWAAGRARGRDGACPGRMLAGALLPTAGLLAHALVLWFALGNPLAFWTAHQVGWNAGPQTSLAVYGASARRILRGPLKVHGYPTVLDWLRLLLPPVFVALSVRAYHRLGPAAGVYAGLAVAIGLLFGAESAGREMLAAVPAFAAAGLGPGAHGLAEGLRLLSLGLGVLLLFAFASGRFVG